MKTNGEHTIDTLRTDVSYGHAGLTKREYFAAMAMGGILADVRSLSDAALKAVAESSVSIADMLIEELNKEEGGQR